MDSPPRVVRCPRCQGDSVFAPSNRWRPFCSERCHTGDFAAWANEEFRVPVKPSDDEGLDDAEPPAVH